MLQKLFLSGTQKMNVFWRFFLSFFVFVLFPSLLACLFAYTYITDLVEREMEKSSGIVIGHFAERTDEMLNTLQNDMIKLLGYSGLDRFLRLQDEQGTSAERNEQLRTFMAQMTAMVEGHPFASDAYLVLTGHDLVVHSTGSFNKDVFFTYINHFEDLSEKQVSSMFSGSKLMDFTELQTIQQTVLYGDRLLASGRYTSAIISYPYSSASPKAYLVVNIDMDQLRKQIQIRSSSLFETAIVSKAGELLAYTGADELDQAALQAISSGNANDMKIRSGERTWKVLARQLGRHDWFYVSLTDIKELNRAGTQIQKGSALLLVFLLFAGGILSYLAGKKMYSPIREIKNELETVQQRAGLQRSESGNELDMIRRWSQLLMSEHRDMAVMINGMSPVMHEHFLGKILLGEFRDELSIEYYAREIGFEARPHCDFAVLCIEVNFILSEELHATETGKSYLMIELKNRLERLLDGDVWLCQLRKDLLVCVLHLRGEDPENDETLAKAGAVADLLEKQEQYRAAIGVGYTVSTMSELHHSYQRAIRLLRFKGLEAEVHVYSGQIDEDERNLFDSFLPAEQVNQFLQWYRTGSYSSMLERALELLDGGERCNATAQSVKQLSADMLNAWIRAVASDNRHDFSFEQYSALYLRIEKCSTWEELRQFFRDAASELFVVEAGDARLTQLQEVAEYIQRHYAEDLALEQLARGMNMSVGHFSRSFKETIGEKYIDYLTRFRIEAAQKLLVDSDLKIDDIAAQVGYLGRSSFIKTFRKLVGVTPGKYREANR
jgi:two-component system response regulator YesN